jgi:CheY-like chemotaxis protein
MDKKRVLLVDDEVAFTRLLKLALEHRGCYTVEVENSPCRAVQVAVQFQPDLVLIDVMMPKLDGGSLAADFKSNALLSHVPIVFLTAAVRREEVRAHQGHIGGLPFLAKPVDIEEVIRCLQQQLGMENHPPAPTPAGSPLAPPREVLPAGQSN